MARAGQYDLSVMRSLLCEVVPSCGPTGIMAAGPTGVRILSVGLDWGSTGETPKNISSPPGIVRRMSCAGPNSHSSRHSSDLACSCD